MRLIVALIALTVVGCTSSPVTTDGCSWARPIYVSQDDSLTDGTAKQILSHDETGKAICGWDKYKGGK